MVFQEKSRMSNEYKNPPAIEAVCEFRLSPETEWDITIPGLIYERVKEKFPIKEQRTFQNVEISSEGSPGKYMFNKILSHAVL
jgi:uncharacterized protein (TIGR04255 family)